MKTRTSLVLCLAASFLAAACEKRSPAPQIVIDRDESLTGYRISGHVVDPFGVKTPDATLLLGVQNGGSYSSTPLEMKPDGSFVTKRVAPGTYFLEVVRNYAVPHSPERVVAFDIVGVGHQDVRDVTVTIRRDFALEGVYRMDSDDRDAPWPSPIVANAFLALDGQPLLPGVVADGAPQGRFVLRNAFGPRVIRCGYGATGGPTHFRFSRVLLDGVDVTDVPTDFSEHPNGRLEVVFSNRPRPRITGTIVDSSGKPVNGAWVVLLAESRDLWQDWATTTEAGQADKDGRFEIRATPGRYVLGVPQTSMYWTRNGVLQNVRRFASGATPVQVGDADVTGVTLHGTSSGRSPD